MRPLVALALVAIEVAEHARLVALEHLSAEHEQLVLTLARAPRLPQLNSTLSPTC